MEDDRPQSIRVSVLIAVIHLSQKLEDEDSLHCCGQEVHVGPGLVVTDHVEQSPVLVEDVIIIITNILRHVTLMGD